MRLLSFAIRPSLHFEAHAAGAAGDDAHRRIHVVGVQVGHLGLGDLLELRAVTLPTLLVFGVPLPLSMPAALRSSTDAGGVLVMKVKLRSA